mgnify:FL=1
MRRLYLESIFFVPLLVLVKYYIIFYSNILPGFVHGFVLKFRSLFFFIHSNMLYKNVMFLKNCCVANINSLLDIVVVDYPTRLHNRFEVTYVF